MRNGNISTAARVIVGDALAAGLVFLVRSLWAPLNGIFGNNFWYVFLTFLTFSAVYRVRGASKNALAVIAGYAAGTLVLYVLYRLFVDRTAGQLELCWFASLFAAAEGAARLKGRGAAISR